MGWHEDRHYRAQKPWVQWELRTKAFVKRWQDDIIIIEDVSMSKEAKKALWKRKKKDLYGGKLELEEEVGQRDAFGYTWNIEGNVVICRGQNKFELEEDPGYKKRGLPVMAGPSQFM